MLWIHKNKQKWVWEYEIFINLVAGQQKSWQRKLQIPNKSAHRRFNMASSFDFSYSRSRGFVTKGNFEIKI